MQYPVFAFRYLVNSVHGRIEHHCDGHEVQGIGHRTETVIELGIALKPDLGIHILKRFGWKAKNSPDFRSN